MIDFWAILAVRYQFMASINGLIKLLGFCFWLILPLIWAQVLLEWDLNPKTSTWGAQGWLWVSLFGADKLDEQIIELGGVKFCLGSMIFLHFLVLISPYCCSCKVIALVIILLIDCFSYIRLCKLWNVFLSYTTFSNTQSSSYVFFKGLSKSSKLPFIIYNTIWKSRNFCLGVCIWNFFDLELWNCERKIRDIESILLQVDICTIMCIYALKYASFWLVKAFIIYF